MHKIRKDFPMLTTTMNGKRLVYLDNAATTHKPQVVIDAITSFYSTYNSNAHRGVYTQAEHATALYEQARATVAHFIGAAHADEIVFTRGTTESINMIAACWAQDALHEGDEIVLTQLEHHANLLPWQQLAQKKNLILTYIPVHADGMLDMVAAASLITSKTKLVAVTHSSNALGTKVDVATLTELAHNVGAKILVDAAQSAPHQKIDVQKLGVDFLAFSGHKLMGPTGSGVLYIKKALHQSLMPYQYGGGMVYEADYEYATWQKMPYLLEAGTPSIAQALGLAAALEYSAVTIDFDALRTHEAGLCNQLIEGLSQIPGVTILGPQQQLKREGHLVSFTVEDIHPHDLAAYLNREGICVRAGHHCAQPLAKRMTIGASVRASFYAYTTPEEVDLLIHALKKIATKA